ncbi:unnamed protein product [Paramecium sonneborni]|uniref:Serine/threonine-protein phosphatase n=1 Tax=Paramecium sonneborni TaxID=65129 RepID=A0A8S1N3W7_9CILI|nr:unnamed protein product [Paramecium sonneborni]
MADQLLQNEKIKEISQHFQQKLRNNQQHLQKIFHVSSEECQSLKEQLLATKYYIDQRCQEYSQLVMDINVKGESRELLKKLADLITINELLKEDIAYYKDTISNQDQRILQLEAQLESYRNVIQELQQENKEIYEKTKQEAESERKELELALTVSKTQFQQLEDQFFSQVFKLENTIKQLNTKIVDLETGRATLIKTIHQKEELIKKQSIHYDTKLTDQKVYWQNKLNEKTNELEQEMKDQIQQWEIKSKCINSDFDNYKKNFQEQIEQLTNLSNLKDKDYNRLKETYDKLQEDFKLKEAYIQTHKVENDTLINDLRNHVEILKELQINQEQKINNQQYEYNKLLQQYKDGDSKFKKEQYQQIQLLQEIKDLQFLNQENQTTLKNYNQLIKEIYKNASSFLGQELKIQESQQMLQSSLEYLFLIIKSNQEQKLEFNEIQNMYEVQNIDLKNKLNKQYQINSSQEKIIATLEKKISEIQLNYLKNSLQASQDSQIKSNQKPVSYSVHKLEDLQVFPSIMEQSDLIQQFSEGERTDSLPNEKLENSKIFLSDQIKKEDKYTQTDDIALITIQKEEQQNEISIQNQEESLNDEIINQEQQEILVSQSETIIEQKEVIKPQQQRRRTYDYLQPQAIPLLIGAKEENSVQIKTKNQIQEQSQNLEQINELQSNENVIQSLKVIEEEQNQLKTEENQEQNIEFQNTIQNVEIAESNKQVIQNKEEDFIQQSQKDLFPQLDQNGITLKEYIDQQAKQDISISTKKDLYNQELGKQKQQNDYQYYKDRKINHLIQAQRIQQKRRKNSRKFKLKLESDLTENNHINCTPETVTTNTKLSRSTHIQTEWSLKVTPYTTIHCQQENEQLGFQNSEDQIKENQEYIQLKNNYTKLQNDLSKLEEENLRQNLILEYFQKNQPLKVTQDASCFGNLDDDIYEKQELLENKLKSMEIEFKQINGTKEELEKEFEQKTKEIENLQDLIANLSDQLMQQKYENLKQKDLLLELKEQLSCQNKQNEFMNQIIQVPKEKGEKTKLKLQSNSIVVRREVKEKSRPSTPIKFDQIDELKQKIFQYEKMIRNLNQQIGKKDEQLKSRQHHLENIAQLQQLQSVNIEVTDLRKQLEQKKEQLSKCYTLIQYLEVELENYKSTCNLFNKPKQQNTERVIRNVQPSIPQISQSIPKKLPNLLQDEQNLSISRKIILFTQILLITMMCLETQQNLQNSQIIILYNYKMIDKFLEQAYSGELLNENAIKFICLTLKEIFSKEPNVKKIPTPVTIVGDVHGQLNDVQELFKVGGKPPFTNYLFLGDYVDRGAHSVEVITLLSLLKVKFPNRVTLIRGNHETRGITQNYGFYMECQQKYGNTLAWEYFTEMFDYIPIACIVGTNLLCVHGGLSPCIENFKKFHMRVFTDIMWSDPDDEDTPGFKISPRGAGFVFGGQVLKEFLHFNNMTHLIRAHQLCNEGFNLKFEDRCITVWSAPNYLYRNGNLASILEIDELDNRYFNIFSESPENMKKDLGTKSMMLGADKNYFI